MRSLKEAMYHAYCMRADNRIDRDQFEALLEELRNIRDYDNRI